MKTIKRKFFIIGIFTIIAISSLQPFLVSDFFSIKGDEIKNEISVQASYCQNECTYFGQKKCSADGKGTQSCGNYDSDSCLEWSSTTNCASGYNCQDGSCVLIATCDNSCSSWSSWIKKGCGLGGCQASQMLQERTRTCTILVCNILEKKCVSGNSCVTNRPPIADAGPDKQVYEEQSVILQGSGSDPDGDSITYSWSCNGGSLSNYSTSQPTFTAPQVSNDTNYVCNLTVRDDKGNPATDSVNVYVLNSTTTNRPPIADAGPDKQVYEGQAVILQGSGSDPDGDSITYSWSCNGGSLSNYSTSQPTFTAPQVSNDTNYVCNLTVRDDKGNPATDSVNVYVLNSVINYITNYYSSPNPRFNIEFLVKNLSSGQENWSNSTNANLYDILSYRIKIEAINNLESHNVIVKHVLPSNITYMGNLKMNNVSLSGNLDTGINIGTLGLWETKIITYEAQIFSPQNFQYGIKNLTNSAMVYNAESFNSATCQVSFIGTGVAGAATSVSTALTNNLFKDSFLIPLFISLLLIWLFRSRILNFEQWLDFKKNLYYNYRSNKELKMRINEIRIKENI